jgi:glycosyltransferase involved in cell wall biosynthesis
MLSYWKLIEYLREFRPQLLHIQNRQSTLFGQKFSRKLRIPHVITVHRVPDSIWPSLAHPQLAGVIAVNEVIREFLVNDQGLPKSLIRVVPRGVNTDELVPETGRKVLGPEGNWIPVLGSVGSLTKLKGHHFFVKAARRVLDRGIEAMFAIVGEGPEEKPLRRLVQQLKLEKHVMFSPHIPDRQELYRVFDIVVVPTLRGGIGSTALEAMAMGKPIIASAVGEILHIVQDEQTGLLVPQGDAEALADRMIRLLTTPDLPETLGRAARERVEQDFALDRMIQGTLGFYDEVVGKLHEGGLTAAL